MFGQGGEKGQIQGTVTDKSGAVVPGVTISIKNLATGFESVVVSENNGGYRFPGLAPGNYYLKAELPGFTMYEVKTVVVNVGRTTDVNVTLEPAGTQTTVTVSEVAPLVETTKTDIGGVIERRELASLPLNGRNFASLATLIPGARPVTSWDPTKTRIGAISVGGAGGRNMETTIDGIENKDNSVGGWVQNIALDSVQEFALKTQRFSASDGRSQGGLLSIVTKSGSNTFHGTWFTFARDKVFNANDYWTQKSEISQGKSAGSLKPDFRRWQYGGSFGGPIKKDTAFFFFSIDRQQESQFAIIAPTTVSELQALVTANISIYGAKPGPSATLPTPYKRTMWTARADWAINSKNNVYLSWNNSSDRSDNDQAPTDLTSTNFNTNRNYLMSMVWNSAVSSRMLNQFVWGSSYWNNLIDTDNYSPLTVAFASVSFGTNGNVPQQTFQKKWQFKDSLIWNRGSHGWKIGVDWVTEPWLGGFFGYTPVPAISFFDNPTTILTDKTKYPLGFSTPGIVQALAETSPFVDSRYTYTNWNNFIGWYLQDDWKVNRKLTLNLGLRYDVDLGIVTAGGVLANDRSLLIVSKINNPLTNGFKNRLPQDDKNNFAPRIGFAFDPTGKGKTVIRGGYGMYYDQLFNNINLFAMQQSNPTIFGTVVNLANTGIGKGDMPTWVVNSTPLPPIPSKGLTDLPAGSTGRLVDPNYESPMSQQFNIGFSHQMGKEFVIEGDFTHNLNIHENRTIQLNYRIVNPDGSNPRILQAAFTAAGLASNQLAAVNNTASVNRSGYDGFNIGVRKRLSHRLTFQTSYTLSRARGYGGLSGEFGGTALDQTNYLAANDYIPTVRDERHRFVWSGVIDLPWGFQANPILQLASARPYVLTSGADTNKDGTTNDLCVPGTVAPNARTCPQNVTRNGQRGGYDLDGNWQSGRFFVLDLRVSKVFNLAKIREGMNLTFNFESFNLANQPNFGRNFSGNVRSTQYMSTLGPATGTYGIEAAAPYQAQLSVRFSF